MGIDDGVDAVLFVENVDVLTCAAFQRVVAGAPNHDFVAGPPIELVIVGASIKVVIAHIGFDVAPHLDRVTPERVFPITAEQRVVVTIAGQVVITRFTKQDIVAAATKRVVVAFTRVNYVSAIVGGMVLPGYGLK